MEGFNKMIKMASGNVSIVYVDYITSLIQGNLKSNDVMKYLSSVGEAEFDLTDENYLKSKTILVEDRNNRQYKITVEEV
jgi:hypothetical protein